MATADLTKTCSKCKTEYPATTEYFSQKNSSKDGLDGRCKACHREYRAANKEKINKYNREYNAANSEEISEQKREYYEANKEKIRGYQREYRAANREKISEYDREYHQTSRGKEVRRTNHHRRRARKAEAPLGLPFDEKLQLKRQKSCCYYCGRRLVKYHVDHVIPLSRGGSDGAENKVLACPDCNLSKGSKLPSEWAKGGRLL